MSEVNGFEPQYIKIFMGGDFTIPVNVKTAKDLKELFQSWAKEVEGWENAEIGEVAIVRNRIHVVLTQGIC